MIEKKRPRAIVLESDDAVRRMARNILERQGWVVTCKRVSRDALDALIRSKHTVALFISNYKLPKMDGEDILEQVKSISPLTRRMLLVPGDRPKAVIKSINRAEINGCLVIPFEEADFIHMTRNSFRQFRHAVKLERMKRILLHQNRQMYNIARDLKKKEDAGKRRIAKKKAERNRLLERHLQHGCRHILELYYTTAAQLNLDPLALDPDTILRGGNREETTSPDLQLIEDIIRTALARQAVRPAPEPDAIAPDRETGSFESCFTLRLTGDKTRAFIRKRDPAAGEGCRVTYDELVEFLNRKQVVYGLLEPPAFDAWVSDAMAGELIAARGRSAVKSRDGRVDYRFKTGFSPPGEISEDGTIDFRKRGKIPYVRKGDLLAAKSPPRSGTPGITVCGDPVPAREPVDPVFLAGHGTSLSGDGREIRADLDGEPHLDATGVLSVNTELTLPGDVGFETGNIDFNGNIIVKGAVKQGFSVRGTSLTVKEIEGGTIELTGDLNVSRGITDSQIFCDGNIRAKFINHSRIRAFGDITVTREILDSELLLDGVCINRGGHILSSKISARQGVEAERIGTETSDPSRLTVGTDAYVKLRITDIGKAVDASTAEAKGLKKEIKKLKSRDQALYEQISAFAHTQDTARSALQKIEISMPDIERSKDPKRLARASEEIRSLMKEAKHAEQELEGVFHTQDTISGEIQDLGDRVKTLEQETHQQMVAKKALREISREKKTRPVVRVQRTAVQGTVVNGPNATITLKEDKSGCTIREIAFKGEVTRWHEMVVAGL